MVATALLTDPGMAPRASAELLPDARGADQIVLARLELIASLARQVRADLVGVSSDALAGVTAAACTARSAVEAARAGLVLEASSRGVVAASDHPRTDRWVEQACREGGAPVTSGEARALHEVATVCALPDLSMLRDAVVQERLPVEAAARVARSFRVLRGSIDYPDWDALLGILIDWAGNGAKAVELAELQDILVGQYGKGGELDREHAAAYARREFTGFRRDRTGMLRATLRLDPASEAVVTAAIHALSAPHQDAEGHLDELSPGQRRADALVNLARHAGTPDPSLPGSGARARVLVTIKHADLRSGLTHTPDPGAAGLSHGDGERGYARTMFDQALSPTEARLLACDAHVIPAVLGSAGEVLDLGRESRLISPAQRWALTLRDGGCTYPGCTMPPAWCDGHHLIHWAQGGPTDMANLALLCRHHHTEVHRKRHIATVGSAAPAGAGCRTNEDAVGAREAASDRGRPAVGTTEAASGPGRPAVGTSEPARRTGEAASGISQFEKAVHWTRWDGTPIGNRPHMRPPREDLPDDPCGDWYWAGEGDDGAGGPDERRGWLDAARRREFVEHECRVDEQPGPVVPAAGSGPISALAQ